MKHGASCARAMLEYGLDLTCPGLLDSLLAHLSINGVHFLVGHTRAGRSKRDAYAEPITFILVSRRPFHFLSIQVTLKWCHL